MPRRYRRRYPRRRSRRRYRRRRRVTARRALAVAYGAKRRIRKSTEKKYRGFAANNIDLLTIENQVSYHENWDQGTENGERIGNSIYVWGLKLDFSMQYNDMSANQWVRVIVVKWNGNVDPGLDLNYILETIQTTTSYLSPYQQEWAGQWKLIYDKTFNVNENYPTRKIKKYFRINQKWEFKGAGVLDSTTKGLYFFAFSDQVTATAGPVFNYNSRIYYSD